ncbi:hypothetical protein Ciccas_010235 [Cichlidogyrus casuarinus]|uniref:Uncharacterized protein n=1 Tax=Cichlidogyrus casuarinus TaxID=1844966 RepID=A0ABD2PUP1_9PLAT
MGQLQKCNAKLELEISELRISLAKLKSENERLKAETETDLLDSGMIESNQSLLVDAEVVILALVMRLTYC